MIRLLKWLIFGDTHLCKYEIIERIKVVSEYKNTPESIIFVQKCEICGKIKKTRIGDTL